MRQLFALASIALLAACSTGPAEVVNYQGQQALQIHTVVMGENPYPPTEDEKEAAAFEVRNGTKWNRLPAQANRECPNGYTVLGSTGQNVGSYLVPAAKTVYPRYTETFYIQCN
tara:strand:- start:255 stop:596 length:342 start_codon:yes stop_codon:yes gene_type:complete